MPPKERADDPFRAPAPTDSASASHTSEGALMQLALLGPFTDQIS
jgi:hypothetical protein